jgi:hypothetical protein
VTRKEFIQGINEKRKQLVNWERLDSRGDDFEEIIFHLKSVMTAILMKGGVEAVPIRRMDSALST